MDMLRDLGSVNENVIGGVCVDGGVIQSVARKMTTFGKPILLANPGPSLTYRILWGFRPLCCTPTSYRTVTNDMIILVLAELLVNFVSKSKSE